MQGVAAKNDASYDLSTALHACVAAAAVVVALVGVQLDRPAPWPATTPRPDCGHGVEERREQATVVHVGGGQRDGERDPLPVGKDVVLRARLPFVRRVPADGRAPPLPGDSCCPGPPGSSRSGPPPRAGRAWPDATSSTRPGAATRAGGASTSRLSRTRAPSGAVSRGCRRAARTESRSVSRGHPPRGAPPSAARDAGGVAARRSPTTYPSRAVSCRRATRRSLSCETVS